MPPVARLQLLTRRDALTACFTVLVAISVVNAADAPPRYRSPVRRVCVCVERKRVTQTAASREPAIVSEALLRATKCTTGVRLARPAGTVSGSEEVPDVTPEFSP